MTKIKITVLGAGLVGFPIALDLSKDDNLEITIHDIRKDRLDWIRENHGHIQVEQTDLSDAGEVRNAVQDADLVVSAVPGHLGFRTLELIIGQGKNVVDIAFFPEDLFELDALAQEKGVIAISDIGVAPGMSNVLTGYAFKKLDRMEKSRIYVGGLPKIRQWPFEYRAVFSPIDVIEEYTRPARFIRDGKLVEMPALSEPEFIDFEGFGTLEAFNSDGLRSLIHTIDCPDMIEKTLRYPGHIDKIKLLKSIGFFSEDTDQCKRTVHPPDRPYHPVIIPHLGAERCRRPDRYAGQRGRMKDGRKMRYQWDLADHFDHQTGIHSMARTTGYTATAAARMLLAGLYTRKGVSPPEYIGFDETCTRFILDDLAQRGVIYKETIEQL